MPSLNYKEIAEHQWHYADSDLPEHVDKTDGRAVYEWLNENTNLDFSDAETECIEITIED